MTLTVEEQKAFFILMGITGKGVDLCDEESLKKAFRNKAKKSHPDLAAHMGKDPRLMKLRFQELNDAFNILMERVQKEQTPYTARSADPVRPKPATRPAKRPAAKPAARSATRPAAKPAARPAAKKRTTSSSRSSDQTAQSRKKSAKPTSPTGKSSAKRGRKPAAAGKKKSEEIFFSGKTPGRNLRFAEFLYYSGYISWTELVQALVWQYRNRPKLGELATESGLLDFAEVLDIIRAKNPYELFGEAAVRLGYLSPSKLDNLVREQKKMGCPIGHYFTSSNLMTTDTLHKKLSENRRHNFHFTDDGSDS